MPSGFVYVFSLEKGSESTMKRTQRGVFLLIFDHGNVISRDTSLIVIWDERGKDEKNNDLSQFDYILPDEHHRQIKEAIKKKKSDLKGFIKKVNLQQQKKSSKLTLEQIQLVLEATTMIGPNNLEAMILNSHKEKKHTINNFSIFDIEMALKNNGGRWRKFHAKSFNPKLRDKYLAMHNTKSKTTKHSQEYQQWAIARRKLLLGEILLDGRKIGLDYMGVINRNVFQLPMGLVLHPHFNIKKDKMPSLDDPLSVVRNFLRFIGACHETRGRAH